MTTITHRLRSLSAGVALTILCVSGPVLAQDSDVTALEARVAQLEALIEKLTTSKEEAPAPAPAAEKKPASSSTYAFGGYIKFNAMFSDYSDGDLAPGSAGTQFYIPGTIPVGGDNESSSVDLQGRESRINFKSNHDLASGDKLSTYIEIDFLLSPAGDERVSNSYNPRLRHAFFKYNNWLFGQTWTTFSDLGAFPESLDFIGPSEGVVFGRQPQIRYTNGSWEFAVENPESTITPFGGGGRIVSDDGGVPDFVGRYTAKLSNGHIKAAVLFRQLNYDDNDGIDDSETGYGISLSGKHAFGDSDIRWTVTTGSGTGRYLGLNTANDAVLDASGNLQAIDQTGGFIAYRHPWTSKWRSSFIASFLSNDNDTALTGMGVTKDVQSYRVNLMYSPVPKMSVGGEISFAERTLESSDSGDMTRFYFAAKYVF